MANEILTLEHLRLISQNISTKMKTKADADGSNATGDWNINAASAQVAVYANDDQTKTIAQRLSEMADGVTSEEVENLKQGLSDGTVAVLKSKNSAVSSHSASAANSANASVSVKADMAETANSIEWLNITNRPETYTPSTHKHRPQEVGFMVADDAEIIALLGSLGYNLEDRNNLPELIDNIVVFEEVPTLNADNILYASTIPYIVDGYLVY